MTVEGLPVPPGVGSRAPGRDAPPATLPSPPPGRFDRLEDRLEGRARADERWKSAIAIFLGVITVTGALLTWRSVILEEQAIDADRRALFETALVERNRTDAEVSVRSEQGQAARYLALLAEAEVLEQGAEDARGQGDEARAQELADRAQVTRTVADSFTRLAFFPGYLQGEGSQARLDVDGLRRAILLRNTDAARLDPDQTAGQANALHARSVALVGWVVALVAALVLLTVARLTSPALRPWLAGAGGIGYVIVTAVALFAAV